LGIPRDDLAILLKALPSLVNFRDYDRRTPLHVAASEGHLDLCKFLVEHGAKINRSDRWGGSPLDDAHRHRHIEVIKFLKSQGGIFGSPSQANNFITAASEGDYEEVKALLDFGNIDVNQGDYDKRTALHLAAGEGHAKVVELLCHEGRASVNVQDRWGNRPLDDAYQASAKDCIKILQDFGAEGNAESPHDSFDNQEALFDLMHQYGKIRKNGQLTMDWHDAKDLLEAIGEKPTDACVKKLFEVADVDNDGIINAKEFIANSDTFLAGRPASIILVVGGPGSGKGVLSSRLVKECGLVHLSSGDLLRDEVARGTALGKQVDEIMKRGELVSSAIIVTLIQKHMKDHPGKRILLDGFPRSQENAQDLVTLCGKPELALHLNCDDTILLERIMHRAASASDEDSRSDDNFHTALQRIRAYHKYQTVTLDFLREQHVPIVYLDGSATMDGVWSQVVAIGRMMRSAVRLPGDNKKTLN